MLDTYLLVLSFLGFIYLVNKYNLLYNLLIQGILSFLSFRNYESLKLNANNYFSVGRNFLFAGLFYLCLFIYFLKKVSNTDKAEKNNSIEINNISGLNQDNEDNDKTEYFLEDRL